MRIVRIDRDRELALCSAGDGSQRERRDRAGAAGQRGRPPAGPRRHRHRPRGGGERMTMKYVDEYRDAELGRAVAGKILCLDRAGPPLQGDGGLRRPHPLDLQVRDRRPAARERRARARPRLPGLRDADGPHRRRHRDGPRGERDLHLLRRHDAGAGLRADVHRRQGRGRRHPHGLLAARRAADRQAEPRPRRRLLRDRLRDHRALHRADPEARQGRGRPQLLLHVQPRHDRAAAAGAARLARPAPRRLHRPRPRLDRGRRPPVRVHPRRLRQADRRRRLRAARHPRRRSR